MLVPVRPVLVPVEAGEAAVTSPADAGAAVWLVLQATMPSASAVLASANFQKDRDIGASSSGNLFRRSRARRRRRRCRRRLRAGGRRRSRLCAAANRAVRGELLLDRLIQRRRRGFRRASLAASAAGSDR